MNNMKEEDKKKHRRVGRPRKPGPKKKRRRKSTKIKEKHYKKTLYKIIKVTNNRDCGYIGNYGDINKVYAELNRLKEENLKVVFKRNVINHLELKDSSDYYVVLERRDSERTIKLRNKYGVLTEQITNSKKWFVLDKIERNVEETFWVYGYDVRDRKTFMWIFENILLGSIESEYDLKRVILFKNKIIIKNDNSEPNLIFCKNQSDSIRFYNLLKDKIKEYKIKQIFFLGSYNELNDKRRDLVEELIELTGWSKKRILRKSTRS